MIISIVSTTLANVDKVLRDVVFSKKMNKIQVLQFNYTVEISDVVVSSGHLVSSGA
jgi:hypothetical protein